MTAMRSLLAASMALALGGCSAWLAPARPLAGIEDDVASECEKDLKLPPATCAALKRVREQMDDYARRAGDVSTWRNVWPALALGSNSFALYRGITDTHGRHGIAALSLFGMGLQTSDGLYQTVTREQLLQAGASGMACVLVQSKPLWIPAKVRDDIDQLSRGVEQRSTDVDLALAAVPDAPEAEAARTAQTAALDAQRKANARLRQIDLAPALIDDGRRLIDAAVRAELAKTAPTAESVATAIAALKGYAATVAPTPAAGTPPAAAGVRGGARDGTGPDAGAAAQSPQRQALVQATLELIVAQKRLERALELHSVAAPDLAKLCEVKGGAPTLTLVPDIPGNTLNLIVNEVRGYAVQSGQGIPAISEIDVNDALDLAIDLSSGTPQMRLTGRKPTTSPVTILLVDGSGRERRHLSVTVAAPAAGGNPPGGAVQTLARGGDCVDATPNDIRQVQRQLGVDVDGVVGPDTRKALLQRHGRDCITQDVLESAADVAR